MSDQTWMAEAACIGVDPELFFPTHRNDSGLDAKRICRNCPVVIECGQAAFDGGEEFGVWGGQTERERDLIRRARSINHGTSAGYRTHLRRGEPACDQCKEGKRRDDREREQRRAS